MNMRHLLLFLLVIVLSSTALAGPLFDVEAVAGKSQKQVEAVLGKPSATEKTKYGPQLTYKEGTVEIVFINGKADWIEFTPKEHVPYHPEALTQIGLPAYGPTFSNATVIRWEPCGGYVSASVFPVGEKVDFFYVKVSTQ